MEITLRRPIVIESKLRIMSDIQSHYLQRVICNSRKMSLDVRRQNKQVKKALVGEAERRKQGDAEWGRFCMR